MSSRGGVRVGAIAPKILKEFTMFENLKKLHPRFEIPNTGPVIKRIYLFCILIFMDYFFLFNCVGHGMTMRVFFHFYCIWYILGEKQSKSFINSVNFRKKVEK